MSMTTPPVATAVIQQTNLINEFTQKFESAEIAAKTNKVAVGIFIAIESLITASTGLLIAFWVLIPLSAVVGLALLLAAVVAAAIFGVVLHLYVNSTSATDLLEKKLFKELLEANDGSITPDKIHLFEKYGKHCSELDFSDAHIRIGVKVGTYLEWLEKQTKFEDEIVHKDFIEYVEMLRKTEDAKQINTLEDLQTLHHDLRVINNLINRKSKASAAQASTSGTQNGIEERLASVKAKIIPNFSKVTNTYDDKPKQQKDLCVAEQVIKLIQACPNLKTMIVSPMTYPHKSLTKAAINIGAVVKGNAHYQFVATQWKTTFPGLV